MNNFGKRLETVEKEKLAIKTHVSAAEFLAEGTGISNPSILKDIGGLKKEAQVEDPVMKVHHKLLAKFEHFSKAFDLLYNNDKKKEGFIDKF